VSPFRSPASSPILTILTFLDAFLKLRKATISLVISVHLSTCNNSAPTGRIFMKFEYFSKICREHLMPTRTPGNSHEEQCTFVAISRWIRDWMRNVSDKICRRNQNTHFVFSNFFPLWDMWKNAIEPYRPQMPYKTAHALWILGNKATNIPSEYVILFALPRQKWLRERASMLRLYIHCLPSLMFNSRPYRPCLHGRSTAQPSTRSAVCRSHCHKLSAVSDGRPAREWRCHRRCWPTRQVISRSHQPI
jgi:hypothetical protein